jgi:hypothetical protein
LDKNYKTKYDKKRRSGIKYLFYSLRFGRKKPKEYRPFLGHNVDPERLKAIQQEGMDDSGYTDYYDNEPRRRRKKSLSSRIKKNEEKNTGKVHVLNSSESFIQPIKKQKKIFLTINNLMKNLQIKLNTSSGIIIFIL